VKLLNALIAGQASEQGQLTVPSWASFARATTRPRRPATGQAQAWPAAGSRDQPRLATYSRLAPYPWQYAFL
jgi:hypothetical protein